MLLSVSYCSADCQKSHWPLHKMRCGSTSSMCCARQIQADEVSRAAARQEEEPMPPELARELARLSRGERPLRFKLTSLSFSSLASCHTTALGHALPTACTLQRLTLEECRINAEAVQLWATNLSQLKELEVLNLGHNQLEYRGLEILVEALKSNTKLNELILTDNLLGPKAGQLLAELLLQLASLQNLNLSENFLQEDGSALMAEVLRSGGRAKVDLTLDLSSNDLRVAGAKAMASLLEMDTVRSLELASNRLHDFGIKALSQPLRRIRGLLFLGLGENNISDEGVEALVSSLQVNDTLKTLELDYNAISEDLVKTLKQQRCQVTLAGNRPKERSGVQLSTGKASESPTPWMLVDFVRNVIKSVKFPNSGGDDDSAAFFDNVFAGRWMSSVGETRGEEDLEESEHADQREKEVEDPSAQVVCGEIQRMLARQQQ
eukprot:symbB.v1.2.034241.t1/scaffold4388.1/size41845/1